MIDGGPSRTGRSGERQPLYRTEVPRRQPEPAPRVPEPTSPQRQIEVQQHVPRRQKMSKRIVFGGIIALVLAAAIAGWFIFRNVSSSTSLAIDKNKYQAVFMSGGQVYFGKLEVVNHDYVRLKQVFYIQSNSSDGATDSTKTTNNANMQLIKLGDEVHGPEDAMVINRDQMLFFENLKSDGKVAQLIQQYSQGNK